ncbi:MAG: hypothetical protein LBG75_03540 [Candidatus Nomurabacteria bacterium]|jgi:hypothetical protein|nr:hypothetical protein [Candidatus Nomurabacteria bacterium]
MDHHKFHTHLPRNKKEQALFILVISLISVNLIAPLITFAEIGLSPEIYLNTLVVLPFLWLCIVPIVLLTEKPAAYLASKITRKGDSFSATMFVIVLCDVLLIAALMTVIGSWIGGHSFTLEPIEHFFLRYPRNFVIALAVELAISQPVARLVMAKWHKRKDTVSVK